MIILGLPTALLQAFLCFLALKKNVDNLSIAVRIAELTPVTEETSRKGCHHACSVLGTREASEILAVSTQLYVCWPSKVDSLSPPTSPLSHKPDSALDHSGAILKAIGSVEPKASDLRD